MSKIVLCANDAIGSVELNVCCTDKRAYAPFGFTFSGITDDGTIYSSKSFNMTVSEAKRLAAFIVENL